MLSPQRSNLRLLFLWAGLMTVLLVFGACSDSTRPVESPEDDGVVPFEGGWTVDEFVLERVSEPTPDGRRVELRLIGSNVRVDPETDELSVDVAVRNDSDRRLFAPLVVGLGDFDPANVKPLNPDRVFHSFADSVPPDLVLYVYDYSDSLGSDGTLGPGETTVRRTWIFSDPGLEAFSFAADVRFTLNPDLPRISGVVFQDRDRDGERDENEPGTQSGAVQVLRPDGSEGMTRVGPAGRWSLPVRSPGLHEVRYWPPPVAAGPLPSCLTTPNPLTVLLPPTPDGRARPYDRADFGLDPEACVPIAPPVILRASRPDSSDVVLDPYALLDIGLRDNRYLRLRVGYGGCDDGHPLQLYAGSQFPGSAPAQTWAMLSHDSRGELCEAWWEEEVLFDIEPLRRRHERLFGSPGPFRLRFEDFSGEVHSVFVR